MKNNDISNQTGIVFGFRCDDFLMTLKDQTFMQRVRNFVVGKSYEIDEQVRSALEFIYRRTEFTVDLVILEDFLCDEVRAILEDIPFNRIVVVKNEGQITARLMVGDLSYYVDGDSDRRSRVNSEHALSLAQASEHYRKFAGR